MLGAIPMVTPWPFVPKAADFLLYLCCSLHLSYSSIASYRSMLSAAFRFVLPELSSHPVLHDLLRSFRLERPLPSSQVPSWDLLRVLSLLWGPPFEPLSSCSLRDLTRKVLFLLSLAMARRVGELHVVSSSGGDLFLSYLPSFGPSPSPLLICCLNPSASAHYVILWVLYLGSYCLVWSVRYRFTLIVLLRCVLVRFLSLSLLALLLDLFPRMP